MAGCYSKFCIHTHTDFTAHQYEVYAIFLCSSALVSEATAYKLGYITANLAPDVYQKYCTHTHAHTHTRTHTHTHTVLEIRIRNWSVVFLKIGVVDYCSIWEIWPTKINFSQPNAEISWKTADG